jgi:hypothetical protein
VQTAAYFPPQPQGGKRAIRSCHGTTATNSSSWPKSPRFASNSLILHPPFQDTWPLWTWNDDQHRQSIVLLTTRIHQLLGSFSDAREPGQAMSPHRSNPLLSLTDPPHYITRVSTSTRSGYTLTPGSSCGMHMASPAVSDSSTVYTTPHRPDNIDDLFSRYQSASAFKVQLEKDLRAAINNRRALALEEFRQAEETFKKNNSACDDMARCIEESYQVEDHTSNGMLSDIFQAATDAVLQIKIRKSWEGTLQKM